MENLEQLDPNHWSHWIGEDSGGCIVPRCMSSDHYAWLLQQFPDYVWNGELPEPRIGITFEGSEVNAEALVAAIRTAMRARPLDGI